MKRACSYAASLLVLAISAGACSDDDGDPETTGAGMAGAAGTANSAGAAGAAGAGGTAGAAGAGGTAGAAGAGGSEMAAAAGASAVAPGAAGGQPMTFFVTSRGDDGGNFGGLEGADAFCGALAEEAGAEDRTWRAFLSTDDVDARTRIGDGPWHNAAGALVAESLTALFEAGVPADLDNAMAPDADARRLLLLDETGAPVSADPLEHDILTGSDQAGNRIVGQNCEGWTSNAPEATGQVGHSDSRGPQGDDAAFGWVSTHASQGCSAENLVATGGNGRIYCFAAD